MKKISVSAAIIIKNRSLFITQRGYGEFKDKWEFPGGKIKDGETPEAALKREIKEELNAEINILKLIKTVTYQYPTFHLTMHCYLCELVGEYELLEHESAKFITKKELGVIDFLPADFLLMDDISRLL